MSTVVRRATREDLEHLQGLAAATQGAPQWSGGVWAQVVATEPAARLVLLAESEGAVSGFVVLSAVAGVAEIEAIAVDRRVQRRGVGRTLVEAAARWAAAEQSVRSLELEVRASNQKARAFYASLGFEEQGSRAGYYAHPVEDAVLLGVSCAALLGGSDRR